MSGHPHEYAESDIVTSLAQWLDQHDELGWAFRDASGGGEHMLSMPPGRMRRRQEKTDVEKKSAQRLQTLLNARSGKFPTTAGAVSSINICTTSGARCWREPARAIVIQLSKLAWPQIQARTIKRGTQRADRGTGVGDSKGGRALRSEEGSCRKADCVKHRTGLDVYCEQCGFPAHADHCCNSCGWALCWSCGHTFPTADIPVLDEDDETICKPCIGWEYWVYDDLAAIENLDGSALWA